MSDHSFWKTISVNTATDKNFTIYETGTYSYESEIENESGNRYSTGMYYENSKGNQAANADITFDENKKELIS